MVSVYVLIVVECRKEINMSSRGWYEEQKKLIEEAIQEIKAIEGYTVMRNPERQYFFVITPKDNVLYVQHGEWTGLDVSLQYRPGRETGRGCRCNDDPVYHFDEETLKRLEANGLAFAHKLKAKMFNSSDEYIHGTGYEALFEAEKYVVL